jgi:hypothetical protein
LFWGVPTDAVTVASIHQYVDSLAGYVNGSPFLNPTGFEAVVRIYGI